MTSVEAEKRFAGWLTALMKDGRAPLVLRLGATTLPLQVVPIHTSGPNRPDGLRDGAPESPGFSFAVAEAALVLDATGLGRAELEAAHEVLCRAGMDDWMDYSHFAKVDDAALAADPMLALSFSSAIKGAGVLTLVLDALGIPGDEVTASSA